MITALGLVCVWVFDHDVALDFYVGKLGFKTAADMEAEGQRWVLVSPPEQPELSVMLAVPAPPVMDEATAEIVRSLVAKGGWGTGALFTDDCRATYEELRAKSVEFVEAPHERFYGVDAAFRDPFGNHWRLTQPLRRGP
ncbi:VOC family protein [Thermoactinospora rubra]|uniref:VOC family protein n=1 Tax=Thermoactinospora rubra TaxID=1088767 RepID=UPI000A11D716|nr:VOC family protein [Thermoactinospora rubra]